MISPTLSEKLAVKEATACVLFCGHNSRNLPEGKNIARCDLADTPTDEWHPADISWLKALSVAGLLSAF
jgi:hypothetical protein